MTIPRLALLLAVLVLATACRTVQPGNPVDDAHRLHAGMFEDEARDALGSPDESNTEADGSETWIYRYSASDDLGGNAELHVHVRDGKVATWEERLGD